MPEPLHSAARILLWCGWAIGVELASQPTLYIMAVVSATAFVFPHFRQETGRLLRRTRWLMLILLLTYAYTLPGHPVWPEWESWSPTEEGLIEGGLRILRLALILIGLAVLIASTQRSRLIYGLFMLARPFAVLGLNRRAFAVRLGLTLEYVEHIVQIPPSRPKQWLELLHQPSPMIETTEYCLVSERWKWRDSLAIFGACSVVLLGLL